MSEIKLIKMELIKIFRKKCLFFLKIGIFHVNHLHMKLSPLKKVIAILFALLITTNAYTSDQEFDSATVEQLDEALKTEFSPCSPEINQNKTEQDTTISSVILSSDIDLIAGEMIKSSGGGVAIVGSYDSKTKTLKYHQTADTGFMLLSIGEIITDTDSESSIIIDIPKEAIIPCFEHIVSIDEDAREMLYISAESLNNVLTSLQHRLDKQRDKAAFSLTLLQEKLTQEEIDAFEAQLEAELAAQEMMVEIIAEEALAKRLAEFQAKLEAQKAAAAASTAAYQSQVEYEEKVAQLMDQLALEKEIAAFEAQLEAELAAQEMMAEIIAEEALAKRLAEFQAKLEAEKAAAAASTAAYQSKQAYEAKVNKIMEDLARELELAKKLDEFKSQLAEELVAQATDKLEEEKVVGAISGEIVTVAGHESCKQTLNLSDHNVELFKRSLAGDYLYNVGPLNKFGTEFSASRWEKYISCIGSYNE